MQQQSQHQQPNKLAKNNEKITDQQRDNNYQFYSTHLSKQEQSNFEDKNLDCNIQGQPKNIQLIPCIQCTQPNQNCQICLGKKERPISENMLKFMQYQKMSYKSERQEIKNADLKKTQIEQRQSTNDNLEKQLSKIQIQTKKTQEERESELNDVDNYEKMIWQNFQKNLIGSERAYLIHQQQNDSDQAV